MPANRSARIVGMGVATALGLGVPAFAEALRAGLSGISARAEGLPAVGGFVPAFNFESRLAEMGVPAEWLAKARRLALPRAPLAIQLSALVSLEAWHGAGQASNPSVNPERVAVLVAGQNISPAQQVQAFQKHGENPESISPRHGLEFLDTHHVGVISEWLGARGEGGTVGAASASGSAALIQGLRLLRQGLADLCVVTGAMADLSPLEFHALRNLGAMAWGRVEDQPAQACRPFDARRQGFVYGQGAACLILAAEDTPLPDGADHFGSILGGAMCLDANRLTDLKRNTAARVMRQALQDAGIRMEEIDAVSAHATSSVQGDEQEAAALREVLQGRTKEVWVNSLKGLTGHCLWSAGVVESAAALLQMKGGFLHPNPNLENPIDHQLRFVGGQTQAATCRTFLKNGFGFGGIYTSLVLRAA